MKILYVASEAGPFIRTGGLGDVAGALPKDLNALGNDTRVVIPFYKEEIKEEYRNNLKYIGSTYVDLSWRRQYCGVFQGVIDGVIYYLIDNEYYFKRHGLYGHFDDAERFAFFSKAVLEIMPLIEFFPDILHCNDWQCALAPVFLDVFYRFGREYQNIRSVFTIHNIEFQGKYGKELLGDILGLPEWAQPLVLYQDCVNFMKGGIESSIAVTTVSETYAHEIMDPFYSYGLQSILGERSYKIHGVVNGIDTKLYNPKTDKALFANYDIKSVKKRIENKKGLCQMLDLPFDEDRPLMAMISRLTEQKGIDLVLAVLDQILAADIQVVILGTGDWKYENSLATFQDRYPNKFRLIRAFSLDIASKLYAASDMFLMPSKFEPCGLSQIIAMRYGSVPIVRETGGLKDTVEPYNPETKEGVGFTFKTYNSYDMLDAVWRAFGTYKNFKEDWKQVQLNGLNKDFGWQTSAKKYMDIYESL